MYASTAPPSRLAAALGVVAPTWQGGPPSLGPGIAQRDLPRRSRPPRPPPSPTTLVALCFAATTVAYIERTGFAIALADAASGERERSAGAALSYFYWGYALSQARDTIRVGDGVEDGEGAGRAVVVDGGARRAARGAAPQAPARRRLRRPA